MKAYVQYLAYSPVTGELYEPCGDRANNLSTWIDDARSFNGYRRPKYPAFRIMLGDLRSAKCIYEETT